MMHPVLRHILHGKQKVGRYTLSGTGSAETDYILKLNVHRGVPAGDSVGTDIFLNGKCKTDFSDVRFTDAGGNLLQHHLHSHGNYEVIYDDKKLGQFNGIYNGTIYASNIPDLGANLYKSTNNGQTYTKILDSADFCYIDSVGTIFAIAGNLLKRSTDGGANWTTSLDMTADDGTCLMTSIAEDDTGNLFFGRYQPAFDCAIFKSTDRGENWTEVYSDTNIQHVHGLYIDPYTGYIYAGLDGGTNFTAKMVRSVDSGANWTTIWTDKGAQAIGMIFTPTMRIFGGGDKGPSAGNAVWITTDDTTFTCVYNMSEYIQSMRVLGDYVYAFSATHDGNAYAKIVRFPLDCSLFEAIWLGPHQLTDQFLGLNMGCEPGTPTTATERQILCGNFDGTGDIDYKSVRIFDGGQHYQAQVFIKLPSLPAGGMDIIAWAKNQSPSISIWQNPGIAHPTPLLRMLINEGAGGNGTTITDSSGNNRHGTLTHTDGKGSWNNTSGRFAGASFPQILLPGASYNFNGGDYINIPTDAIFEALIKDFTVVVWVKIDNIASPSRQIFGKGRSSYTGWSLQILSGVPRIEIGVEGTNEHHNSGIYLKDNWHMIGVIIDNSTPAQVSHIIDGIVRAPIAFAFDISADTGLSLRIGSHTSGGTYAIGGICDVQVYPYQLTQLQVQQLYENRPIAATEPAVVATY